MTTMPINTAIVFLNTIKNELALSYNEMDAIDVAIETMQKWLTLTTARKP